MPRLSRPQSLSCSRLVRRCWKLEPSIYFQGYFPSCRVSGCRQGPRLRRYLRPYQSWAWTQHSQGSATKIHSTARSSITGPIAVKRHSTRRWSHSIQCSKTCTYWSMSWGLPWGYLCQYRIPFDARTRHPFHSWFHQRCPMQHLCWLHLRRLSARCPFGPQQDPSTTHPRRCSKRDLVRSWFHLLHP